MTTLVIVCVVLAPVIYAVIFLWPQRIPKDRTVAAIRHRIESESETRGHNNGC
ncbi:hypothetical protein [Nocardia cerradoensis]|uniref:Uncharacterized protein n=1 Tax=Nocardia cerradoensis TaxID=85688 RepID=A0A231GTF4_9NOCA|nr:hypothetical protein [Nocardia cerradoensis]NKY48013.1 hypothetical protein [Nocardia cerradoensis]OXR39903.1 hypothetical protein B7C42_08008 [Nocardia cerradoensis]